MSEATGYRILRRAGLVKSPEMKLLAGKEYQGKTTGSHQLWATDASYFRVVGWGYYYLVTVMDDYSPFVLAWKLQTDMTADSLIEVVQLGSSPTGGGCHWYDRGASGRPDQAAERQRLWICVPSFPRLPPPGGDPPHPGFTLPASDQREAGAVPPEHQAGGKQLPYEMPADLEQAIAEFVDYYNYRRYHKALGNVTPDDVLPGRRDSILAKRKEVQTQTLRRRQLHNQHIRQLENSSSLASSLR